MGIVGKIRTLRLGDKLIIFDGKGPIRTLDLVTNKVHIYKTLRKKN